MQKEIRQHYAGFTGPKHHRNKTGIEPQTEIVQFQGTNPVHAHSSENLNKNIIMRSAESIDSANRVPEIKTRGNQSNYVRKKQISEIVQGKPTHIVQNFEITSKSST